MKAKQGVAAGMTRIPDVPCRHFKEKVADVLIRRKALSLACTDSVATGVRTIEAQRR